MAHGAAFDGSNFITGSKEKVYRFTLNDPCAIKDEI